VVVRPSGTEPKLKAYLEVVVPVGTGVPAARASAAERIARLVREVGTALTGVPGAPPRPAR
jgi:phosphomannomutase